jgi:hypothetical protein
MCKDLYRMNACVCFLGNLDTLVLTDNTQITGPVVYEDHMV